MATLRRTPVSAWYCPSISSRLPCRPSHQAGSDRLSFLPLLSKKLLFRLHFPGNRFDAGVGGHDGHERGQVPVEKLRDQRLGARTAVLGADPELTSVRAAFDP